MPVNSVPPPSAASSVRGSAASSASHAAPVTGDGAASNAPATATHPDDSSSSGASQQRTATAAGTSSRAAASSGKRQSPRSKATTTDSQSATSPSPAATAPAASSSFGQTLASSLSAAANSSQQAQAQTPTEQPQAAPAATQQPQTLAAVEQLKGVTGASPESAAAPTGKPADTAVAERTAAGDDADAQSTSDTQLASSAAGDASAATPLTAHAAEKNALPAPSGPLSGANPGAPAALAQADNSQDEEDGATAVNGSAGRASTPLPQPLTMVVANSGGSAPDPQNTDGGTQGGDDSNAAATAAAASMNATGSAGSTHSQTQSVELQPVHTPVGTEGWSNEVGARLTLMAQQGMSSASLRLSPAHLGPLEIHISVRDSSATVMFGATQNETRTALEQALPRLREMFASQGLNLSHAGVSGETPRGAAQNGQSQSSARNSERARETTVMPITSGASVHQGLIDTYA